MMVAGLKLDLACVGVALIASIAVGTAQAEPSNLMLIFDSSGSMKKVGDGLGRNEAAKNAVVSALRGLPSDVNVGLLAFGHRRAKDCTDMEMVVPLGSESAQSISNRVLGFAPIGETPIAAAIEMAAADYSAHEGENNAILLVTDGIEECGGDPCAAARKVMGMGLDLKIHIVGLSLDPRQRAAIECLSNETGGKYFAAEKTTDLSGAVAEAVQVAQATPEPAAPPQPKRERVFFDDFDQVDLSEAWDVVNPNPDAFIVESGGLLMVNSSKTGFEDPNMQNLVTLRQDFPRGDWDAELVTTAELKTGSDQILFGLRKDEKNYLAAVLWTYRNGRASRIVLSLVKSSGGELTRFDTVIRGSLGYMDGAEAQYVEYMDQWLTQPFTLRLSKRGRNYFASMEVAGEQKDGAQVVYMTDSLTSLRPPGPLTVGLGKHENWNGEVLVNIDSVEILSVTAGQ